MRFAEAISIPSSQRRSVVSSIASARANISSSVIITEQPQSCLVWRGDVNAVLRSKLLRASRCLHGDGYSNEIGILAPNQREHHGLSVADLPGRRQRSRLVHPFSAKT